MNVNARQGNSGCNSNYAAPPGEPCIPGGEDLNCSDLGRLGISEVRVTGRDVYRLDLDKDGVGCEGNTARVATPIGDASADAAPFVAPIVGLVLGVMVVVLAVRMWRLHKAAETPTERRSLQTAWLSLAMSIPVGVFCGLLMAMVGLT